MNKKIIWWKWNYRVHQAPPWILWKVQENVDAFSWCCWIFQRRFRQPLNQSCQKIHILNNSQDSRLIAGQRCTHGGIHVQKRTWNQPCHDKARNVVIHCNLPITLRILREHFLEDKAHHFNAGRGRGMVVVRRKDGISSWRVQVDGVWSRHVTCRFWTSQKKDSKVIMTWPMRAVFQAGTKLMVPQGLVVTKTITATRTMLMTMTTASKSRISWIAAP